MNLKSENAENKQKLNKKQEDLAAVEKLMSQLKNRRQDLQIEINHLVSENQKMAERIKNDSLKNRIKDLEVQLQQEREWHQNAMRAKDEELKKSREESQKQLSAAMEVNAACAKFLEGTRTGKRKRDPFETGESSTSATQLPSTAKSDVDDVTGKPYNKGSTDEEEDSSKIEDKEDSSEIEDEEDLGDDDYDDDDKKDESDGAHHIVDSNNIAFISSVLDVVRKAFEEGQWNILEPFMYVEVIAPEEFQESIVTQLNQRKGVVLNMNSMDSRCVVTAEVPFKNMLDYSSELASSTQGKGIFTMEYSRHSLSSLNVEQELIQGENDKLKKKN